jgi:hypothetical protein
MQLKVNNSVDNNYYLFFSIPNGEISIAACNLSKTTFVISIRSKN